MYRVVCTCGDALAANARHLCRRAQSDWKCIVIEPVKRAYEARATRLWEYDFVIDILLWCIWEMPKRGNSRLHSLFVRSPLIYIRVVKCIVSTHSHQLGGWFSFPSFCFWPNIHTCVCCGIVFRERLRPPHKVIKPIRRTHRYVVCRIRTAWECALYIYSARHKWTLNELSEIPPHHTHVFQ